GGWARAEGVPADEDHRQVGGRPRGRAGGGRGRRYAGGSHRARWRHGPTWAVRRRAAEGSAGVGAVDAGRRRALRPRRRMAGTVSIMTAMSIATDQLST